MLGSWRTTSQVALEHIADIDEELLPQWLVEAELLHVVLVDLLQLFSTGPTHGKPADDGVDRVARDEAGGGSSAAGPRRRPQGPGHLSTDISR